MTADCRLYLITPPLRLAEVEAFAPVFAATLNAGGFASALARVAPDAEADAKKILSRLIEIAHAADVALLVERDARLAARVGADGALFHGRARGSSDAFAGAAATFARTSS